MRKTPIITALLSAFGISFAVLGAADAGQTSTPYSNITPGDSGEDSSIRLFAGASAMHRQWFFYDQRPISQDLLGGMIGLEHFKPDSCFWRLTYSYQGGNASNYWFDHETELQGHLGYSFSFHGDALTLTPYTGLGYFCDKESESGSGVFKEIYNCLPIGVLLGWRLDESWSVGLRSQLNIVLQRRLKHDGMPLPMQKKNTWRSEFPISYRLNNRLDLSLIPFYDYDYNALYGGDHQDWGAMHTYGARLELGYYL